MNNILSIFQICIYCQLGVVCQNIDCLFYGAGTETIVIENDSDDDDDQNIARSFQLAVEITDKLGISPGGVYFRFINTCFSTIKRLQELFCVCLQFIT